MEKWKLLFRVKGSWILPPTIMETQMEKKKNMKWSLEFNGFKGSGLPRVVILGCPE